MDGCASCGGTKQSVGDDVLEPEGGVQVIGEDAPVTGSAPSGGATTTSTGAGEDATTTATTENRLPWWWLLVAAAVGYLVRG